MVDPHSDCEAPTVEETARFLGANLWLDQRLFTLVGGWVPSVDEPAVKLHLDAQARHHAWHASLWSERMPVTRDVDVTAATAPTPGVDALLAGLAAIDATGDTVDRLAGLVRVVMPRLAAARRGYLARCTPWADAALARSLRFALQDGAEDGLAGEVLLQALLRDPAAVRHAIGVQERLEAAIVEAGGLFGTR